MCAFVTVYQKLSVDWKNLDQKFLVYNTFIDIADAKAWFLAEVNQLFVVR